MPSTLEDILSKLEKGENVAGEGLRGLCFEKTRAKGSSFVGCDFSTSHFMKAALVSCRFERCVFDGCDLRYA